MARKPSAWNRFFAARRKRGLSAKQIGVEWRRKKRGTKRKSPTVRRTRRANPKKTGGRRVARKKIVSVNLVELGGGLIIADQMLGTTGVKNLFAGDIGPVLTGTAQRLRDKSIQSDLIKTGVSVMIIKAAAQSLGQRRIGKIGPLVMRV